MYFIYKQLERKENYMKGSKFIAWKNENSMACPKLNFLKGNTDTYYFIFISFQIYVNMQKQPFIS